MKFGGLIGMILALTAAMLLHTGCARDAAQMGDDLIKEYGGNVQSEESEAILLIGKAENEVLVTVEENEKFESCWDTVLGAEVTHSGSGIIHEVFSCADFGSNFDGTYSVIGQNLKKSVFCFKAAPQKYDPISCGVNYYDSILQGSAYDCGKIKIRYGESVVLEAVKGEFELYFFTLSASCPMQFGADMLTVSGSTEEYATVSLSWDGEAFFLVSDKEIMSCAVKTESADRTVENTAEADSGFRYTIRLADGIPTIGRKAG